MGAHYQVYFNVIQVFYNIRDYFRMSPCHGSISRTSGPRRRHLTGPRDLHSVAPSWWLRPTGRQGAAPTGPMPQRVKAHTNQTFFQILICIYS